MAKVTGVRNGFLITLNCVSRLFPFVSKGLAASVVQEMNDSGQKTDVKSLWAYLREHCYGKAEVELLLVQKCLKTTQCAEALYLKTTTTTTKG